jgi:hypothetical protein
LQPVYHIRDVLAIFLRETNRRAIELDPAQKKTPRARLQAASNVWVQRSGLLVVTGVFRHLVTSIAQRLFTTREFKI